MAFNQLGVANPGAASYADGSTVTAFGGKQGETLTSDVHGKWYTAAYRGKVFVGSTAAAGVTIPISTTTAATFMLYNPIGSGVNVELISVDVGLTVVTSVASPLLFGISSVLTVAPTGLTALTVNPAILGGSAVSTAKLYSAATITATTVFYTFGHVTATNATAGGPVGPFYHYEFDGRLNVGPGVLIHACGTAAQTNATTLSLAWAEWPV